MSGLLPRSSLQRRLGKHHRSISLIPGSIRANMASLVTTKQHRVYVNGHVTPATSLQRTIRHTEARYTVTDLREAACPHSTALGVSTAVSGLGESKALCGDKRMICPPWQERGCARRVPTFRGTQQAALSQQDPHSCLGGGALSHYTYKINCHHLLFREKKITQCPK